MSILKIIDFEKNGNVVRFFLGNDNINNYWGDDWNDAPYESNAGNVYNEFIVGYIDVAFSLDYVVLEPSEDWYNNGNSYLSKEDFKNRKCPCIIIGKNDEDYYMNSYNNSFSHICTREDIIKFYFNDSYEDLINKVASYNGSILLEKEV